VLLTPNSYQVNPTSVAAPAGPVSQANGTTPVQGTMSSSKAQEMLSPDEYNARLKALDHTKGFMNSLFGSNHNTWNKNGSPTSYDQELANLNAARDAYNAANKPATAPAAPAQPPAPAPYQSQFGGDYQAFQAPQLSQYLSGVNGVNQGSVGQAGQFKSNAPALNTTFDRFSSSTPGLDTTIRNFDGANAGQDTRNLAASGYLNGVQGLNQDAASMLGGVRDVNQAAPQFNQNNADLYAKKAFEAQMALLRPELDKQQTSLQNSLALQGLNPGTEANTNAQSAFSMARAAQENALAASSYLSGGQSARDNFATELSGFNAGNAAQNQAFNQSMNIFGANNAARTQELANRLSTQQGDLAALAQSNAARNTMYSQGSNTFDKNLQALQTGNAARSSQLQNELSAFGANQRAAELENAARGQMFQQDLASYGANLSGLTTNAQLNAAQNAAQQQAYGQAVNNYGMDYQSQLTARNQPLNELNALMGGQQVSNPQFSGFFQQGNAGGADILGATQAQGQWNQGIFNQQAAAAAGNNSAMAGAAGTVAMAAAIYF
jgi:hypothetical protein